MTIQEMKNRKKELGFTNEDIAQRSGVPLSTVNKIFSGTTSAPRRATLLALESVLAPIRSISRREGSPSVNYMYDVPPAPPAILNDPGIPYIAGTEARKKQQGEYTLEDYLALPEDVRVELIDGVFYDMAAPFVVHQFIATQIGYQLMGYMEKHKGPCMPVLSPVDVQLDCDDKTVVQPDVLILCKPEILIKNGRVFGAPDFIIEILSKSTRRKDMTLKLSKYSNAGVREYWIVDPENRQIVVYDLENDMFPKLYSFQDKVPVLIWNSDFSVDFQSVYEYVKDYL